MNHLRRFTSVAAAAALFTSVAVAAPLAASADVRPATAGDCQRGANGFVDIPDTQSGRAVDPQQLPAAVLTLQFANIGGVNRGFAKLTTAAGPIYFGGGEQVWMDWSWNGGKDWLQCGPFIAKPHTDQLTSAAKNTDPSPNWKFRAGAWVDNRMYLTGWH
ncbi:hypothetical protein [Lentzea aerocolonigenes]|uniref:hypothetical protein n=1 Tax=Lentzea aerocolonigenes TaxID=68170 RepID=UPI000AAFA6DA|nr:hypothetical protein [Lentzea aerocolonigenes]